MSSLDRFENTKFFRDGFRIVKELGEGTTGNVYLVEKRDHKFSISRAVKHIKDERRLNSFMITRCGGDKELAVKTIRKEVQSLLDEISILANVRGHGNIALYIDHETEFIELPDGAAIHVWILKEYYKEILGDLIKDQNLDLIKSIKIMGNVASALEFLHRLNIIHRDIKPHNILWDTRVEMAKLDDFGQSKATRPGMTHTVGFVGTPLYSAPEVDAHLSHYDGKLADIYSLGAVFYECVSLKAPFCEGLQGDMTQDQILKTIYSNKQEQKIGTFGYLNPLIEDVVNKSTAPDPGNRFQDISEMHASIQALLKPETYNATGLELIFGFQQTGDREYFQKALANFNVSIQLDTNYKYAWLNRGNLYKVSGDLSEARRCYEQALQIDPDYDSAIDNLNSLEA